MKKNLLSFSLAVLVVLAMAVVFGKSRVSSLSGQVLSGNKTELNSLHNSGFFEAKEEVAKNLSGRENGRDGLEEETVQIGITSHHLPVAAPLIASLYKSFLASYGPRGTFVILGPDHFEKCKTRVALTENGYRTPFGEINIDQEMLGELKKQGFQVDNDCFEGEHSIGVQAIFIKYLYPSAKIVPIVFSSGTSDEDVEKLTEAIYNFRDEISIIASVDFSHYNSYEEANRLDRKSEKIIREMDGDSLKLKYVDSPPAVKTVLNIAKRMKYGDARILSRGNSYEFTGRKEATTGYMSIIFKEP